MSELNTKFTREDLETLIESIGDWEALGSQDFHILQIIKDSPMPPEDHEAFEFMKQIKDHYRKREKDIKRSRDVRQEKAVFIKAKLMLARRDLAVNQMFDMAAATQTEEVKEVDENQAKLSVKVPVTGNDEAVQITTGPISVRKALDLAEAFIKDLGVWKHYQSFLAEKSANPRG